MANTEFRVITIPDDKLLTSFIQIWKSLGSVENAKIVLTIQKEGQNPNIECQISEIDKNELVTKVVGAASTIVRVATLNMQTASGPVHLAMHREDGSDRLILNTPNPAQTSELVAIHTIVREAFRQYDRTGLIDRELSPALAEFYERREASLLRLEELSERIIRQNEEYRRKLDVELDQDRSRLDEEHKQRAAELETEHATKLEALTKREKNLDERETELDDRSNTHARRQLQRELKNILKDRSTQFSLTAGTTRKRHVVHALFLTFIMGAAAYAVYNSQHVSDPGPNPWFGLVRFIVGIAAFLGGVAWYIRWQDAWSQSHADEEFRLKRLDLDIDRASWLVEMLLEWKAERGTEIPPELLDRLSYGLFHAGAVRRPPVRHPSEELMATLLSASAGIRLSVPGLGEVTLDRKSLRDIKKVDQKPDADA